MVTTQITQMIKMITQITTGRTKNIITGCLTLILISANIARAADDGLAAAKESQEQISRVAEQVLAAYVFIGSGSGVIISEDGYVLTNYHVVGSSKKWQIYDRNGKIHPARRLGYDSYGDIALLKIESDEKFPYLEMGDSDSLKTGQPVIAAGNPFGQGTSDSVPSVSFGIISGLHYFRGSYSDAIQTDAAVNPGNSGGPLVTLDGKLVGINGIIDARFAFIKANTGIGYAVPVNQIKKFLPYLKSGDQVNHGYIEGLVVPLAEQEPLASGAKISGVKPGSQADKLKLGVGDEIVKIDDYGITFPVRFHGVMGTYPAGSEVTLTVKNGEKTRVLKTILDARPAPVGLTAAEPGSPFLGVALSKGQNGGVKIEEIVPGSPAAESDLRVGDIITAFDGQKADSIDQLINLIKMKKTGDTVAIKIKRGLIELEVPVTLRNKS